jgi:SAM-dependent methyltransferase
MHRLAYTPFERVPTPPVVDRLAWIAERCAGRDVLDLGCYDETAADKHATEHWLHGRIARVARRVLGVDSSPQIPDEGIVTGERSRIVRGDVLALDRCVPPGTAVDTIVAGEVIEHLPDALAFLLHVKRLHPGKELIATTPNATSLTNCALAIAGRESNHPDHVHIFSVKTLYTLCLKAGLGSSTIIPYFVKYPELMMRVGAGRRRLVQLVEKAVNAVESRIPLLAGGLILHVDSL